MLTCKDCVRELNDENASKPIKKRLCRDCAAARAAAYRESRLSAGIECSELGCVQPAANGPRCYMHENRVRRNGEAGPPGRLIQTGDAVAYQAVHRRLKQHLGVARDQLCPCGQQADEWAYVGNDPRGFSTALMEYVAMCWSCHRRLDAKNAGEANVQAVLTDDLVRALRLRYAKGGISQAALAAEYGTTQTNVSHIVRRKTWRHIT